MEAGISVLLHALHHSVCAGIFPSLSSCALRTKPSVRASKRTPLVSQAAARLGSLLLLPILPPAPASHPLQGQGTASWHSRFCPCTSRLTAPPRPSSGASVMWCRLTDGSVRLPARQTKTGRTESEVGLGIQRSVSCRPLQHEGAGPRGRRRSSPTCVEGPAELHAGGKTDDAAIRTAQLQHGDEAVLSLDHQRRCCKV